MLVYVPWAMGLRINARLKLVQPIYSFEFALRRQPICIHSYYSVRYVHLQESLSLFTVRLFLVIWMLNIHTAKL